jgi:hypothetical protein
MELGRTGSMLTFKVFMAFKSQFLSDFVWDTISQPKLFGSTMRPPQEIVDVVIVFFSFGFLQINSNNACLA